MFLETTYRSIYPAACLQLPCWPTSSPVGLLIFDAVTCSDRCRVAEYRKREARAKAEALFKSQKQIAEDTFNQAWMLERNQFEAASQNDRAEELRVKHIRLAGVQSGVLAVHAVREIDLRGGLGPGGNGGRYSSTTLTIRKPATPK